MQRAKCFVELGGEGVEVLAGPSLCGRLLRALHAFAAVKARRESTSRRDEHQDR